MGLFNWKKKEEPKDIKPGTGSVKNIIAVASGKGGVGKSTVTTNMALMMAQKGMKVGVIDADLYGPTQPGLLGSQEPPKSINGQIMPIEKDGVKFISMASINPSDEAMVVRAPIAIKAIQQFLGGVCWGELDFLFIDLPPGTGDIQLTLAQQARLSGAVIVTTPQKVAVDIAKKGLSMFKTVNVPILGIVENMSGMVCSHCNELNSVFGKGGGSELAENLDVPFLGEIPLDLLIMQGGDDGKAVVLRDEDSAAKKSFANVCEKLVDELIKIEKGTKEIEPSEIQGNGGQIEIKWNDGSLSELSSYDLRLACPCASCVDENTGKRILDPKTVPLDITILGQRPVGRYGVTFNFSDGHNTGIYKYVNLKAMGAVANKEGPSFSV
ncbi:MAG: P-loop NTPase [Bacteriovoracaceae bacterium]